MGKYSLHFEPFRFWVQQVLPQVYDDSLSYYELLSKVISQLNDVMAQTETAFNSLSEDTEQFETDMTNKYNELMAVWKQLQDWVANYFNTLDVQEEINNKLDAMVEDGTFNSLLVPIIMTTQPPLVVDSTTEMTNHSRMYILRSNSHIYQWNGTAFYDTGIVYGESIGNVVTFYSSFPTDANTAVNQSVYIYTGSSTAVNYPVQKIGLLITYGNDNNQLIQFFYTLTAQPSIYQRFKNGNTFSDWYLNSIQYLGTASNAGLTDCNDAKESSLIMVTSNIPNRPETVSGLLITIGQKGGSTFQTYQTFSKGYLYYRSRSSGGTWTEWAEMLSNKNVRYVTPIDDANNLEENTFTVNTGSMENTPVSNNGFIESYGNPSTKVSYQLYREYNTPPKHFARIYKNSSFSEWLLDGLQYLGTAANANLADCNNAIESSLIMVTSDIEHKPISGSGLLITIGEKDSSAFQTYQTFSKGYIYYRYRNTQNVWNNWLPIVTENNVTYTSPIPNANDLPENNISINTGSMENAPIAGTGFIEAYGNPSTNVAYQLYRKYDLTPQKFARVYKNGAFSNWLLDGLQYLGTAANAPLTDCDNALESSLVMVTSSVENTPVGGAGLLITIGEKNKSAFQTFQSFSSGHLYYRSRNTSAQWTKWAAITSQSNGKMYSIGNSILTGSVWKNQSLDHLSSYNNAPYGVIANAIGISRLNETHRVISSTGLLYDAGNGNFLTNIKQIDLSEYDVLLTHLWTRDLDANFPLGNEESVANDGSLVGAVKELNNYRNTSNRLCQIILLSVPPVATNPSHSGETVFTGGYPNGESITSVDTMMHSICDSLNICYIDYQNWNISKHYQDYTDGGNVHADNEDLYRCMGAYLGGRASKYVSF